MQYVILKGDATKVATRSGIREKWRKGQENEKRVFQAWKNP